MRLAGKTFVEFLQELDNMHGRIALTFPALTPPSFDCTDIGPSEVRLHYHSTRQGLSPMVIGLIRGLAEVFKLEGLVVTHDVRREHGGAVLDRGSDRRRRRRRGRGAEARGCGARGGAARSSLGVHGRLGRARALVEAGLDLEALAFLPSVRVALTRAVVARPDLLDTARPNSRVVVATHEDR